MKKTLAITKLVAGRWSAIQHLDMEIAKMVGEVSKSGNKCEEKKSWQIKLNKVGSAMLR